MRLHVYLLMAAVGGAAAYLWIQRPELHMGLYLLLSIGTLAWIGSLLLRNANLMPMMWGPVLAGMAWFYLFTSHGVPMRRNVFLCVLVTVWGLRLAWLRYRRYAKNGEDVRFQPHRDYWGKHFAWVSLFRIFLFYSLFMWVLSAMFYQAMDHMYTFHLPDFLGIGLWWLGYWMESKADRQLDEHKAGAQPQQLLRSGLWQYSRHPNYVGESLIWWGYFCFAASTPGGWVYVCCPLLVMYMLCFVTGIPLVEARIKAYPGYQTYREGTSRFFPLPSKRSS